MVTGTARRSGDPQPGPSVRIAEWTRRRFGLPAGALVLVADRPCAIPGGPPFETRIVFWSGASEAPRRHHLKIFKPLAEVVEDDLPPYWMKDALAVAPGDGCDCC